MRSTAQRFATVDGGITRGADIVKAIALGARAVGLGRPFLYGVAFGEAGASKAIRILKDEIETTMAVLGLTSLDELDSSYLSCHTICPPINWYLLSPSWLCERVYVFLLSQGDCLET